VRRGGENRELIVTLVMASTRKGKGRRARRQRISTPESLAFICRWVGREDFTWGKEGEEEGKNARMDALSSFLNVFESIGKEKKGRDDKYTFISIF